MSKDILPKNNLQYFLTKLRLKMEQYLHVIQNKSGTNMTERATLQFTDADVVDDSTNAKTKVSVVRRMTKAQFDALSEEEKKGVIETIDEPNVVIGEIKDDKVEVTANAQTTFSALLNELWTKIDITKVNKNSCMKIGNDYFVSRRVQNNWLIFSGFRVSDTVAYYETISLEPNNKALYLATYTKSGSSWSIEEETTAPSGTTITLYYGTQSAPIELTIDAEHCMMTDGETSVAAKIVALTDAFIIEENTFMIVAADVRANVINTYTAPIPTKTGYTIGCSWFVGITAATDWYSHISNVVPHYDGKHLSFTPDGSTGNIYITFATLYIKQ